jgi:hypothetical protein
LADRDAISRFVDALFRYATEGNHVALHSFYHDARRPPADVRKHKLQSIEGLINAATRRATHVANLPEPTVFAPPICTFATASSAAEANLAEGLALSVECDARPEAARQVLEGLLGRATILVASGGEWADPGTGEVHEKLHLHWRLAEPTAEGADHQKLKRARRLAALIAESDASAVPLVHPLRWPGSWHLKAEPRLARIIAYAPDSEIHLEEALSSLEDAANLRDVPLDDQPRRTNGNSTTAEDDDLMALAHAIPNNDEDWERYNLIGMAFYAASGGSDAGRAAFNAWASKSSKAHGGADARWDHYRASPPTKLSIGKLIYLARQADPGFRLPSWDKARGSADPNAAPADDWEAPLLAAIDELNAKHFVARLGGQSVIATLVTDNAMNRDVLVFSQEKDIRLRYAHRHFLVGFTQKGSQIWKGLGDAWIAHRNRRTYDFIDLIPRGACPETTFNIWRGFGVEPKAGDWRLIRQHLLEVVCSGNELNYGWLIGWLARAVQYPELHAEVAVVLRGLKGTGKGSLAQILMRLFRNHALQISNPNHFTGRFNGHLVDVLFLFVDEAFWAGDKAGEGTLKALVTEPTIPIEPKFVNLFTVKNRLKILMASNADWVVPASADERRYFVLNVADCRRGDRDYFTKLHEAINGAELQAFLGYLLSLDLSDFDFRNAPHTDALNEQKLRGAESLTAWWYDCLNAGEIVSSDLVGWPTFVATPVLHDAYVKHAHDHGDRRPITDVWMARRLGTLGLQPKRLGAGTRPRGYVLPDLDECRQAFLAAMRIERAWPDEEIGP